MKKDDAAERRRENYRKRMANPEYREKRKLQNKLSREKKFQHSSYRELFLEKKRVYAAKIRAERPDRLKEISKKAYEKNKIAAIKRAKKFKDNLRNTPELKHKLSKYSCTYYKKHTEQLKEAQKTRYKDREWCDRRNEFIRLKEIANPEFYLRRRLRSRMNLALKNFLVGKRKSSTVELLGCTIPELVIYLENLFQPDMTWANKGSWHIDHIRPCSSFELSNPEQQKICFNYTNLQPLWAIDNLKKTNKLSNEH